MSFIAAVTPPVAVPDDAWWFVYKGNRLLVHTQEGHTEVFRGRIPEGFPLTNVNYIGRIDGADCYCADVPEDMPEPERTAFHGLRGLYGVMPEDMVSAAGTAFQVLLWDRTHRLCGACGRPLVQVPGERGRRCEHCDLTFYPRITPAIITAVVRDGAILLAHNHKFAEGLYSLVAGFVEAGESLEECVRREIREEVGIEVGTITYFGSQPWPFPNSLMIGFFAEYGSGEIRPDGVEIDDARWFSPEAFPKLPSPGSISRKIIDAYVERYALRT